MVRALTQLKNDPGLRASLAASGLETIRKHHTCAHRAEQLMQIYAQLRAPAEAVAA
jgi:spore maturation protein CgeB